MEQMYRGKKNLHAIYVHFFCIFVVLKKPVLPVPIIDAKHINMEVKRTFDLLTQLKEKYSFKQDILSIRTPKGWIKYSVDDYYRISHQLAYGLLAAGFEEGDRVIIITLNRPEWNFLDMALALAHMISIPVYPTLSEEDYRHILNHSGARAVFVGTERIFETLKPLVDEMTLSPELFTINQIDGCKNWNELLQLGEQNCDKWAPIVEENKKKISPEEVCTIIYTSGTTGLPKGVMLKHIGLTFNAIGHANMQIKNHTHRMLSFLPLCHIYERSMNYEYQYLGISTYYAESLRSIARDMQETEADGFCAVPRVMEMMYEKLQSKGNELKGLSRYIYQWAFKIAQRFDYKRKDFLYKIPYAIADKLVYSKWRAALGGHELLIVSGGSSIQEKIIRLYTAAKMYIFEGYGMTETSPVIAVNNPKEMLIIIGTVGKQMPGIEMKLAEDGEILTKGICLMAGYYNDPEATKQVIDEEGWFHTGDIGRFNEDGYLRITDRKKEIFKLSAGKYIAPQMLENRFKESPYIENIMVIGENEKFASALIVPDFNRLQDWAQKNRISCENHVDLINNAQVKKMIMKEIDVINDKLAQHEQLKRFQMVPDEWSVATGELSQTMKLKRRVILKKYEKEIKGIYLHE